MILDTNEILNNLISGISGMKEVQAIGVSGSLKPLPKAGEHDIDVFIYCDRIPELKDREIVLNQLNAQLQEVKMNVFEGGHWGTGDFVLINGVETWFMYFTESETLKDVEAILNGDYPDKLDNYYYPVGRCAMLKNINVLWDKNGFLQTLKTRLNQYPEKLEKVLINYHLEELEDTEDLERAVRRTDVLFYHFAMDLAIDHFLQALFAMNKVYFPSRKRTLEFIQSFDKKPEDCCERLMEVLRLGGYSEGIEASYTLWNGLVKDLKKLDGKDISEVLE